VIYANTYKHGSGADSDGDDSYDDGSYQNKERKLLNKPFVSLSNDLYSYDHIQEHPTI